MAYRKVALGMSVLAMSLLGTASAAFALPGDEGMSSSHPFRLNDTTLEPGCFVPSRGPVDLSSHISLETFSRELHASVDRPSPVNVDQVLVPSAFDGYRVYNTFENTGRADDIGPDFTAINMFAPDSDGRNGTDPVAVDDVIVCVSGHGAAQNEPYVQEAGGLVAAKNRPILAPKVTALGQSAITNLQTYKIGFGYDAEQWYTAPTFDGAAAFPTVTDPNAIPSPTFGGGLPSLVALLPRPAGAYDARRENDVDAAGDPWLGGEERPDYGQNVLFGQGGDDTGWTLSNNNESDTLGHLVTFTAQGDLPISWTLRASLAPSAYERSASFTDDDFRAWNAAWQAYYRGAGCQAGPSAGAGHQLADAGDHGDRQPARVASRRGCAGSGEHDDGRQQLDHGVERLRQPSRRPPRPLQEGDGRACEVPRADGQGQAQQRPSARAYRHARHEGRHRRVRRRPPSREGRPSLARAVHPSSQGLLGTATRRRLPLP